MAEDKKEQETTEKVNNNTSEDQVNSTDEVAEESANPVKEELSETEELGFKLQDAQDKYLRLYSEFENFRRRSAKEKIEMQKNASAGLAKDMLSIVDDFERATKANDQVDDVQIIKEGFTLIHDKLVKTLTAKGVKEIDATGEVFDVDKHEALTQIPVDDDQKGKVVEVIEKGYYMNDTVIRYAKVVVGQ